MFELHLNFLTSSQLTVWLSELDISFGLTAPSSSFVEKLTFDAHGINTVRELLIRHPEEFHESARVLRGLGSVTTE